MTPNSQDAGAGPALKWFKSSHSSNDGPECVEVAVARTRAAVHIRDSKNTAAAHLTVAEAAWADFVGFATREGHRPVG